MTSALLQAQSTLNALYADSAKNDPIIRASLQTQPAVTGDQRPHFEARQNLYMPVNPQFGNLIYSLARTSNAKSIVEFGTSFGISTIFLAAAATDNGGGKIITTEFIKQKAERARKNLATAGLLDGVEVRVGDVLTTLADNLPPSIDLLFLDGAKNLYLPVLKLVESRLRPGALVISDNTDHAGMESFLVYIRETKNGYLSSAVSTSENGNRGHEISVRLD